MSGDDFSMMDLFREEVRTHAATLSRGLVALESAGGGGPEIEPLMRAAHSIKGAARIFSIEPAVRLAHAMEDALRQPGRRASQRRRRPAQLGRRKAVDLIDLLDREDPALAVALHDDQPPPRPAVLRPDAEQLGQARAQV